MRLPGVEDSLVRPSRPGCSADAGDAGEGGDVVVEQRFAASRADAGSEGGGVADDRWSDGGRGGASRSSDFSRSE